MQPYIYPCQIRGDSLPAEAVIPDPQPVKGTLLESGQVKCGRCGGVGPNSDIAGLMPSCSTCWVPVRIE